MANELAGKVAIITGSSRGIGRLLALAYAQAGADIVVCARTEAEEPLAGGLVGAPTHMGGEAKRKGTIHTTAGEVRALGRRALAVKMDVREEEDVNAVVEQAIREFGHVDVLVNNAAIMWPPLIKDTPVKRWDLVFAINVRGPFLCTKAVMPHMMERKRGAIINISSRGARMAMARQVPYGSSKAALERFTIGIAEELREYNIAVNALAPDLLVHTEGWDYWGRTRPKEMFEEPEYICKAALWLAQQDAASFTGQVVYSRPFVKEKGLL